MATEKRLSRLGGQFSSDKEQPSRDMILNCCTLVSKSCVSTDCGVAASRGWWAGLLWTSAGFSLWTRNDGSQKSCFSGAEERWNPRIVGGCVGSIGIFTSFNSSSAFLIFFSSSVADWAWAFPVSSSSVGPCLSFRSLLLARIVSIKWEFFCSSSFVVALYLSCRRTKSFSREDVKSSFIAFRSFNWSIASRLIAATFSR